MSLEALFWLAAGALGAACLAAVGARSLAEFSRSELEEICRRRNSPHRLGQIIRAYPSVGLAAESAEILAAAVFVGALVLRTWRQAGEGTPPGPAILGANAAGGALALLAAGIWVPWAMARLWAAGIVYFAWPIWRAAGIALFPAVLGARFFSAFAHRLAGRPEEPPDEKSFEEEIRTIVTEGHREGLLEEDAREMIEGVMQLAGVDVSQIMVPRTDMVTIPVSLSWAEVVEFVVRTEHTRIPVYEKNRDDIVGILHAKDLLPELAKPAGEPRQPWTALLREPYFVPETKPVDVLLQEFQRTRNHMAVVLDEYGGVSGLVTLEDVLEEIVGEIEDEYDEELVDGVRDVAPGVAEASARVHIDEINERLGLELPEDADYDTIGGFVFSELGHVPVAGEEVVWRHARVTVLEATRRRIERVRIENLDEVRKETA